MAERGRTLIGKQDLARPIVKFGYALMIAILLLVALATLFPLVWVVISSVKSSAEIFRVPPTIWPENFQWGTYLNVWSKFNFPRYFKNTVVLIFGIWVVQMLVTTLAAYSLSKLKPPGHKLILFGFLAALMVPGLAMMIPKYVILKSLPLFGWNLLDSYWAFWLPAGANAFNILLLKTFFDGIPDDLVDAATIDGASELRTFAQIVLPLSKPILATLTIFIFLGVWNNFMWPYIVITTTEKQPLMVAIYNSVFKSNVFAQNDIMAAITIAIIPPIAVFFALQKHITRGITLTGLKG